MNPTNILRTARWLALCAGGIDTATGLGLVSAPALTLRCMLAPVPGDEALLYVRFIGAFVTAVGGSYLLAGLDGSLVRLRAVFRLTLLFRGAAGLFTGGAVLAGALAPAWLAVTVTDLALVGIQIWFLTRLPSDHE